MAVAASDQHTRRNQSLFRNHDVFDALSRVAKAIKGNTVFGAVFLKIVDQQLRCRIMRLFASCRVHMVNHRQMRLGSPNAQPLCIEPRKRLRAGAQGAMASRCAGVTRRGTRCSITSTSLLADERGHLAAEPLQRGGAYCRFHARPFVTRGVEQFDGPAVLFFLDLESTGVDTASDQIVELACCHAPSDPRASGAAISTTIRATVEHTAFHVHGIDAHEISSGPDFTVAWSRFLGFVEHLQMTAVQDSNDIDCDLDDCATRLPTEPSTVVMAAHNGIGK